MTSEEMEAFGAAHSMPSLPEMVHGGALVRVCHSPSRVLLEFTPQAALLCWNKTCHSLPAPKVAGHRGWQQDRQHTLVDIPSREYDWTFFSQYSGSIFPPDTPLEPSSVGSIPYDRLRLQEPILLFDHQVLMEDELADNGTCIQTCRIRVMPSGFFILHRILMRLDDVIARVCDTRVYHQFGTDYILHEVVFRSNTYDEIRAAGRMPKDPSMVADENVVVEMLEKKSEVTSMIRLKTS